MSAVTGAGYRGLRLVERLTAALADPVRRERTVFFVLFGYVAVWTSYGVIAKSSQDLHFDMGEIVTWAREPAFGYPKHPPFAAWVAMLWFGVFPPADWSYHLLAVTTAAVGLWIAWRLSADFLDAEKRVLGLALLTLVPFFNFHALKYNVNTVLIPLWAATAFWFLRSFATCRPIDAVLAGICAAAAMLGKYWSIFLLAGLGLAALIDPRRGVYFRSAAPWVTMAAGTLALSPHLVWLATHDFAPFAYAHVGRHAAGYADVVESVMRYLAGGIGYVAVPAALAFAACRPSRTALADVLWPADRRLVTAAFWAPLLLPVPIAFATGIEITALWTMSAASLLPVVLLSSPLLAVSRQAVVRVVAVAVVFPLVMVALAPGIAIVIHRAGVMPSGAHTRQLADEVAKVWRQTTERPLRLVGDTEGTLAYGVAFYLPSRPSGFPALDRRTALWVDDARIAREGIALVSEAGHPNLPRIEALAAKGPAGRRAEVEITRRFLGVDGAPARYVIVTIPPQP